MGLGARNCDATPIAVPPHLSGSLGMTNLRGFAGPVRFQPSDPTTEVIPRSSRQVTQVERSFMDEIANLGETCVPLPLKL